jgi:hypothetical protein
MPSVKCPHCQVAIRCRGDSPTRLAVCLRCSGRFSISGTLGGICIAAKLSGSDLVRNHRCQICDCTINRRQAVAKTCDNPVCKRAVIDEQMRRSRAEREATRRREAAELRRQLIELRDDKFQSLGREESETYELAILPANTFPLTNLPAERRSEFAEHLLTIVQEAYVDARDAASADDTSTAITVPEAGERAVLGNACATCRGHCCQGGGEDHAFLEAATVRAYRARHPHKEAEEICSDYLSHVANVTYEGSCVYHAESGCALPREMRSAICNSFFCKGLKEFRRQIQTDRPHQGFAVAMDDSDIVRLAIIDEQRTQPVE